MRRQMKNLHMRKRAYIEVAKARRRGELPTQPCLVCNVFPAEAHHEDYAKPLDIRWLCRRHHRHAHGLIGDGDGKRTLEVSVEAQTARALRRACRVTGRDLNSLAEEAICLFITKQIPFKRRNSRQYKEETLTLRLDKQLVVQSQKHARIEGRYPRVHIACALRSYLFSELLLEEIAA